MVVKDVRLLNDGFFMLDMGMLVWMKPQYYGKLYRCALKSLLVVTDKERILIDTGMGDMEEGRCRSTDTLERERSLLEDLDGVGQTPDDITMVINTHLHFDHCGWNKAFTRARFVIHKDELVHARKPHRFQKGGYYRPFFEGLDFELVDRDSEITEGVHLICTPGHTPGHMSVLVEHDKNRYIFCGDTAPLEENFDMRNVVGITTDPVQCLRSLDRLRSMDGIPIFAHDNEQMVLDRN